MSEPEFSEIPAGAPNWRVTKVNGMFHYEKVQNTKTSSTCEPGSELDLYKDHFHKIFLDDIRQGRINKPDLKQEFNGQDLNKLSDLCLKWEIANPILADKIHYGMV